ncbi:uncharacterized protein YciI [Ulvibacter sp. MAR_2010_11]|uniref:YciI family protein n=1 Tax=Ulvibacter sp. MAR_2010_11 TaxID=1250229 RepID=UPI000CC49A3A|nr:uncharacterized protein YciI [Ulvibacter sp. MAR_2010_11]
MKYSTLLFVLIALSFSACKNEPDHLHDDNDHNIFVEDIEKDTAKESIATLKKNLVTEGYEIFDYVDTKTGDTILMQQYFMAFLKKGPNRSQSKAESDSLQAAHLAHLGRMYEEGYADISGPFGDDGDIRGITIYNVPTLQMADSLANMDPMVKAGRLVIEMHPWWAAKGFPLR